MKGFLWSLLSVSAYVLAIVPDAPLMDASSNKPAPGYQSLPDLFTVADVKDLKNFDVGGSLKLDAGRLVFDNGQGYIWSKSTVPNSKDEWTIDLVFRNSEIVDTNDHSFVDFNGFSFWLVQKSLTPSIGRDTSNFGGPSTFDGFQFLVNNKEKSGLKIFANDGSKQITNQLDSALGTCSFQYLDSMVPFTLRISYSASKNVFKVQVDNNLCFKTDALTFKNLNEDMTFGVTGGVHPDSKEYWEILKLNVHSQLTEDAIDDHGIISDGGKRVVTVVEEKNEAPNFHPSQTRESLMERTRKWIEQERKLQEQQRQTAQDALNQAPDHLSDVSSKLSLLESLLKEDDHLRGGHTSQLLEKIIEAQVEQMKMLNDLSQRYSKLEQITSSQIKEAVSSIVGDIRTQRQEIADISRRLNVVVEHGEKQANNAPITSHGAQPDFSEFFSKVIKWVLLPIVIGITVLSVFVHRLRRDIKHSKLL